MEINRDSATNIDEQDHSKISKSILEQNLIVPQPKKRLNALDVHRGLTMIGMILVDNSGSTPWWALDHAEWDGLTPADLIFPSFIFIMGIAIPLAVSQKNPIRIKSIIRIFALFGIGVLLNLFSKKFNFQTFRIMGILQRLSICYGVTLLIHVFTSYGRKNKRIYGSLVIFILAVLYLVCMISFENPDSQCNKQNRLNIFCNYGKYADSKVLTQNHMFHVNGLPSTDPQGLFTTLSAIVTAYIGYYFSLLMSDNKNDLKRLLTFWIVISLLFGALSYPLTYLMPYNKKIWSISFTFLTVGIAGLTLSLLVILIDIISKYSALYKKIVDFIIHPFVWLGRNPLAVFVLMDVLAIVMIRYILIGETSLWSWFYTNAFTTWISNPTIASTVFSVFFLILWTTFAGVMYRFNIFIRL